MNDLKRSLEKAIEELRDTAPAERLVPPAPDSIEAALAYAPSVSPHYRPSDPEDIGDLPALGTAGRPGRGRPATRRFEEHLTQDDMSEPVEHPGRPLTPSTRDAGARHVPSAAAARLRPSTEAGRAPQETAVPPRPPVPPSPPQRSSRSESRFSVTLPRFGRAERSAEQQLPEAAGQTSDAVTAAAAAAVDPAQKRREHIRIAGIIVASCIGGLVSGWLGSMLADSYNARTEDTGGVAGVDASRTLTGASPNAVGRIGDGTGKADRYAPIDENRCTVLSLDRATGLTLAHPCRDVATAEVDTTLTKSDLLARP